MSREITLVVKDPSAIEPYGFDWTLWLAGFVTPELVVNSVWSLTGKDAVLTLSNDSIVTGNQKTQVVLNAGTLGKKYTVTNRITTTSGYVEDMSFPVLVQQT